MRLSASEVRSPSAADLGRFLSVSTALDILPVLLSTVAHPHTGCF